VTRVLLVAGLAIVIGVVWLVWFMDWDRLEADLREQDQIRGKKRKDPPTRSGRKPNDRAADSDPAA
jgi:hypothetical protein